MGGSASNAARKVSRTCIVLNARKPYAAAERASALLRSLGEHVDIVVTSSAAQGQAEAARALSGGAERIVAAGGDGTVMSVLRPVVDANATLALLPLGTANDFGTYLGVARMEQALSVLEHGVVAPLDVGEVEYATDHARGGGLFCSSAGLGVMGRLAELEETRAAKLGKRWLGNGVWPLLAAAATLTVRFSHARIALDGVEMERDIGAFEIAKLPAVGGFEITPDASAGSGMLHAWIAEGTTRRELLHTLRCALAGSGKLLQSRHLQYVSRNARTNALGARNVQRIDVEASPPLPVHLNGDYVGTTPATFRVRPRALRMLIPSSHPLLREVGS